MVSYTLFRDLGTILTMRAFFFLFLSYAVCGLSSAQLPSRLDRIVSAHEIPYQGISILVRELNGENLILEHLSEVPRNPASTIKLLTTWVALEVLGPTYRWPTEISRDPLFWKPSGLSHYRKPRRLRWRCIPLCW